MFTILHTDDLSAPLLRKIVGNAIVRKILDELYITRVRAGYYTQVYTRMNLRSDCIGRVFSETPALQTNSANNGTWGGNGCAQSNPSLPLLLILLCSSSLARGMGTEPAATSSQPALHHADWCNSSVWFSQRYMGTLWSGRQDQLTI